MPPNERGGRLYLAQLVPKRHWLPFFSISLPRERLHFGILVSGLAAITYSPLGHQDL